VTAGRFRPSIRFRLERADSSRGAWLVRRSCTSGLGLRLKRFPCNPVCSSQHTVGLGILRITRLIRKQSGMVMSTRSYSTDRSHVLHLGVYVGKREQKASSFRLYHVMWSHSSLLMNSWRVLSHLNEEPRCASLHAHSEPSKNPLRVGIMRTRAPSAKQRGTAMMTARPYLSNS
jgi:hypothetical protein